VPVFARDPRYNRVMAACHFCGTVLPTDLAIYRNTECPECSKPLKICRNCEFYAKGAHWDCHETIPDPVRDKDRANFCDYFRPRAGAGGTGQAGGDGSERSEFDNLFGN